MHVFFVTESHGLDERVEAFVILVLVEVIIEFILNECTFVTMLQRQNSDLLLELILQVLSTPDMYRKQLIGQFISGHGIDVTSEIVTQFDDLSEFVGEVVLSF